MSNSIESALIEIARDTILPFAERLTLLKELRKSLPPETNRHHLRNIVLGICAIAVLPPTLLAASGLFGGSITEQAASPLLQVSSAAVGALAAYFTARSGSHRSPDGVPAAATVESTIVEISRDRKLSVEQRCLLIDELRNWLPPERNRWTYAYAGYALCAAALFPPMLFALGALGLWKAEIAMIAAVLQVSATALGALAAFLVGRRGSLSAG